MKNNNKVYMRIMVILPILLLIMVFMFIKTNFNKVENNKISTTLNSESVNNDLNKIKKYKKISDLIFEKQALVNYGKVVANTEVKITPEVPGKVSWVDVKIGDAVKKGDVLLGLNKFDEENSLQAARLNLEISSLSYNKILSPVRGEDKEISKKDIELKNIVLDKTKRTIYN